MAEYIDREAFKKSVEEYYCKPCKAEGKDHNGCWCRACWVDDMLDEIDCFQPAADVAPVVHSYWEHKITSREENISICHNCKYPVSWFWGLSKYCPNCGAKMDGGDSDEVD